jgi:catechol 2,3-dioxygenase-like lactoylglutathione lyase family enzyme
VREDGLVADEEQGAGTMTVKRIVPNVPTEKVEPATSFYRDVLGMTIGMDLGWIVTFVADGSAAPQVSIAVEGGSGTPVPDISVEVDDLDEVYARATQAGFAVEYGPVTEPWGVRRFFVRDPFGRLLNILMHEP